MANWEDVPEQASPYKVSPDVQAARDEEARKLISLEQTDPRYSAGDSLDTVNTLSVKKKQPMPDPRVEDYKWQDVDIKKVDTADMKWEDVPTPSFTPATDPDSVPLPPMTPTDPEAKWKDVPTPKIDPTRILPGSEPYPNETGFDRAGQRFIEHGVGAFNKFKETFGQPGEHPEYGALAAAAGMVPQMGASVGFGVENALRRTLPGVNALQAIRDSFGTGDMAESALRWKTMGEGANQAMINGMPDYFKKELAKPGAQAAGELFALPFYPLAKGTEAIGEKYGAGTGAIAEHLLNLGLIAAPAALKKAPKTDPVGEAFRDFLDKAKGLDPQETHAASLAGLEAKLNEALPPTRQRYVAPDNVPFERHLSEMVESGTHTVTNVLDAIASSEQQPRINREIAKQLSELGHQLGLDTILAEPTSRDAQTVGGYNIPTDTVRVKPGRQGIAETTIHEAVHAVTNGLLSLIDPENKINLKHNPQALALQERARNFNKLYENVTEAQAAADHMTKNEFLTRIDELGKKLKDETITEAEHKWFQARYGFKDVHEFASEFLVDKNFQNLLKEHTIRSEEVPTAKVQTPHRRVSAFLGAREYFNRMVAKAPGHSMAKIIADHLFDLMDEARIQERTREVGPREGMTAEQKANAQLALENAMSRSRAMDQAEAKFQGTASVMEKLAMGRISTLRKSVTTYKDFLIRLKADAYFKNDHDFILNNARRLWDNDVLLERLAGENGFKNLPPEVQKWAADPRDINTFIKEEFTDKGITKLELDDDISNAGTWFFNPSTLEMTRFNNGPAGKIARWFYGKTREVQSLKSQIYEQGAKYLSDWHGLSRKDQLSLWDAMQEWNKPEKSRELKARGEQWIPDDELQAKGLSEDQIKAYHGITDMLDFHYDLVNETNKRLGLPEIEKVPGYIPNIHEGAYKVFVKMGQPDSRLGKGFTDEKIVSVQGFQTSWMAKRFVKELEEGKHDRGNITMRPEYIIDDTLNKKLPYRITKFSDVEQPLGAAFSEYHQAYKNQLALTPETMQVVENLQNTVQMGMLKAALERSSVSGYRGEFGQDRSTISSLLEKSKIGAPINTRMIRTFDNAMRQVSEYYGNGIFMKEVKEPILDRMPLATDGRSYYGSISDNLKNLHNYLNEYGMNFTGEPVNRAKWVDQQLQTLAIKAGLPPNIIRESLRGMRNYLSLVSLRGNPRNYVANSTQFMHTIELLQYAAAGFEREGLKTPNALASLKVVTDYANRTLDKDTQAALQWAKDIHLVDPQLEAQMHMQKGGPLATAIDKGTLGFVNPAIEGTIREVTFVMAYDFMKKMFPNEPQLARDAASKIMRMTMVEYNRAERPGMYNNLGTLGEVISPFAVFRNAWAGNQWMMLKKVLEDPLSFKNYKPLLTTQMMFWTMAGTMGIMGAPDYNNFVNLINKFLPEYDLPRLEEILMKSGDLPVVGGYTSSDAFIYGPMSAMTGINLSSSASAPGPTDLGNLPMVDFTKALVQSLGVGVKAGMSELGVGNAPTKDDIWGALRPVTPSILRPQLEKTLKGDLDISPQSKGLTGTAARDRKDQLIYQLTGGESLKVTREKAILADLAASEKNRKDAIKDLVTNLVDQQMGIKTTTMSPEEIERRWSELSGDGLDKLGELITQGIEQRRLSQRQRIAKPLTQDAFRESLKLQQMERNR